MANKIFTLTAQEISPHNSPTGSMNTYYENNMLSNSSYIIHDDASLVKCNTFVMTEDGSPVPFTSNGSNSPLSFENSPNGLHAHYDKFGTYGVPTNSPMDSPMNSPKRIRNIHMRLFKNKRSFSMDDLNLFMKNDNV